MKILKHFLHFARNSDFFAFSSKNSKQFSHDVKKLSEHLLSCQKNQLKFCISAHIFKKLHHFLVKKCSSWNENNFDKIFRSKCSVDNGKTKKKKLRGGKVSFELF